MTPSTSRSATSRSATPPWRDVLAMLGIALLGLLAYADSFRGGFVFDDVPSIVRNTSIHDLGGFLTGGYRGRPNRAIGYLTLALNYRWGGLDPAGYHAVNLAIHLVNALLVRALVVSTFATPRLVASRLAPHARTVAFIAAALFVAHPLQTQAVTYVVQRLASLATTFCLLTVVLYARWRRGAGQGRPWARAASYLPILLSAAAAMKTKEIAFTLPLAVCVYELLFFEGATRQRLLRLVPLLATLAIIPLTLVGASRPVGEALSDVSAFTRVQTTLSRTEYLATELPVVVRYLGLLAAPVGQNVDHDVPVERAPGLRVLGALALLAVLAGAALYLGRASAAARGPGALDPAVRLVSFGIAWFFLALAVESSLIPIVDVMYEHRVYLPSVGFFVAVATAWVMLAGRICPRQPVRCALGVAGAVAAVLSVATFERNAVWADDLSLWSDAAAKSPDKSRPHNNLGTALEERGRTSEAEERFLTALRLDPENAEASYNLGRLRLTQGRYLEALPLLRLAIELQPRSAGPYANLAGALNRLGRYPETIRILEGARAAIRESGEAHFNLAVAYLAVGDRAAALREAELVRSLAPALAAQLAAYLGGG